MVDKSKRVIHHFNEKHKPSALLSSHLIEHVKSDLAFIIPADTRFGLYLLMLHRLYIMRPALQSCVRGAEHMDFCSFGELEDDAVVEIVCDDLFWSEMLKLLTLLMPVLRLIRMAELNGEIIGITLS